MAANNLCTEEEVRRQWWADLGRMPAAYQTSLLLLLMNKNRETKSPERLLA